MSDDSPATHRLLVGLPEATPQIEYSDVAALQRAVEAQIQACIKDSFQSPFLIVTEIPRTVIEDLDTIFPDKHIRSNADCSKQILLLETMVLTPHEWACGDVADVINDAIRDMGLRDEIGHNRETTVRSGDYVKQADDSWRPIGHHWDSQFPSLVLEVGLSETPDKLAADARGWIETLGSGTEAVLTVDIDRTKPRITFTLWEGTVPTSHYPLRSHRRNAYRKREVVVESLARVTLVTSDFAIPFEKVFGRGKLGTEYDISFDRPSLSRIAERVWSAQGFIG